MTPQQIATVHANFDRFVAGCRLAALEDREIAEWLLSLSARWLHAHGYSRGNIHLWVTHELNRAMPAPLMAAAAQSKDFGDRR